MTPTPKPSGDDEPEPSDAHLLFGDEPARPAPPPVTGASAAGAVPGETYDVEDEDEEILARPAAAPIPIPTTRAKVRPEPEKRPGPTIDPSDAVEQVWSRGAEWGATLALLAAVAAFLGLLIYVSLSQEQYGLAVFFLVVGSLTLVVLSYPIIITLERPVRMTPEQAVNDYYAALSHHLPHYRRMWLLLSTAGRTSGSFGSFDGFKAYWQDRLTRFRGERASKYTPLKFQVTNFKSDKSAGQTVMDVKYSLAVLIRGQVHEGPVATFKIDTTLVRGPDRMWYLDRGTVPDAGE